MIGKTETIIYFIDPATQNWTYYGAYSNDEPEKLVRAVVGLVQQKHAVKLYREVDTYYPTLENKKSTP
jgi:hypothetical protein